MPEITGCESVGCTHFKDGKCTFPEEWCKYNPPGTDVLALVAEVEQRDEIIEKLNADKERLLKLVKPAVQISEVVRDVESRCFCSYLSAAEGFKQEITYMEIQKLHQAARRICHLAMTAQKEIKDGRTG